jgi:hypothetical protein
LAAMRLPMMPRPMKPIRGLSVGGGGGEGEAPLTDLAPTS